MVRALIDGLHELGKYNDNVVFFIADDMLVYRNVMLLVLEQGFQAAILSRI